MGVGCFVDSCRECENCLAGEEQYCLRGEVVTYNGRDYDGEPTFGGYSRSVVVDEDYVLGIPEGIGLDAAAPLLCAGITLYSPLNHWGAGPGKRVAIVGMGGLGHMGVKIAHAMGAEVTVLSQTLSKQEDGTRFGADHYYATSEKQTFKDLRGHFDLIVNTVAANLPLDRYLSLLRLDGTMVNVGIPDSPDTFHAFSLAGMRRTMAGSKIGGIRETQEMLDFCAEHGLGAEVEVIGVDEVDAAYDRVVDSRRALPLRDRHRLVRLLRRSAAGQHRQHRSQRPQRLGAGHDALGQAGPRAAELEAEPGQQHRQHPAGQPPRPPGGHPGQHRPGGEGQEAGRRDRHVRGGGLRRDRDAEHRDAAEPEHHAPCGARLGEAQRGRHVAGAEDDQPGGHHPPVGRVLRGQRADRLPGGVVGRRLPGGAERPAADEGDRRHRRRDDRVRPHQIRTRWSGSSHSPSPSTVPNTSWNSSRLRAMLARRSGGEWGSTVRYCSACSRRRLVRHT